MIIIASDFDGTLNHHGISEDDKKAIKKDSPKTAFHNDIEKGNENFLSLLIHCNILSNNK